MVLFPFKMENSIDDVLQYPGAGEVPFFGHMAYQNDGNVVFLGDPKQDVGAFPDLRNAAGCRRDGGEGHGLDGVHHDHIGLFLTDGGQDGVQISAGQDK